MHPVSSLPSLPPPAAPPQEDPVNALLQALVSGAEIPENLATGPPPMLQSTPMASPSGSDITPDKVQALLDIFIQELNRFLGSNGLDRAPPGASLPPELAGPAGQLVQMGLDVMALVVQLNGPTAAHVLQGEGQSSVANSADDVQLWARVVAAVSPSPAQVSQLASWRTSFLAGLDACYSRRLVLKTQVRRSKGSFILWECLRDVLLTCVFRLVCLQAMQNIDQTPNAPANWAEALLLQAAGSHGYALPALAVAELTETLEGLQRSVAEEREAVINASKHLLQHILSPLQALGYLGASHPFSWNVLAFAHAAAGPPLPLGPPGQGARPNP